VAVGIPILDMTGTGGLEMLENMYLEYIEKIGTSQLPANQLKTQYLPF